MIPIINPVKGKRSIKNIIQVYLELRKNEDIEVVDLQTIRLTFIPALALFLIDCAQITRMTLDLINDVVDLSYITSTTIATAFTIGTLVLSKTVITNSIDLILTKLQINNIKAWIGLKVS